MSLFAYAIMSASLYIAELQESGGHAEEVAGIKML